MLRRRFELSPIGLDVVGGPLRPGAPDAGCIRAAQLRFDRRDPAAPPRIAALARLARPASRAQGGTPDEPVSPAADFTPEFAVSLMGALARQGFIGDHLVLHMPHRSLLSATLDVPPRSSGAPLDIICRHELARTHRLEPELIECGWWELPPPPLNPGSGGFAPGGGRDGDGVGAQVMAVGCRSTDAEDLLALFDASGARVRAIDSRGLALARACRSRLAPAPQLTAIIEWDWEAAVVVILRGDTLAYERCLPEAGLDSLLAAMGRKLGLDGEVTRHLAQRLGLGEPVPELDEDPEVSSEARRMLGEHIDSLALELRASSSYASRRFGDSVHMVMLCGEGASIPDVTARLQRHLDVPMQVVNPWEFFPDDYPHAPGDDPIHPPLSGEPSLAVALGLAAFPREALA